MKATSPPAAVAPQQLNAAAPLSVKRPPPTGATGKPAAGATPQETVNVDTATVEALKVFATGLKSHQGKSKLILFSRLVDHVLGDASIEHITYFQKLCRKKVVERATADGVQVNTAN